MPEIKVGGPILIHESCYRAEKQQQAENPPAEVELTPTGCIAHHPCPLATFLAAAARTLDPAFVKPDLVPVTLAP